MFELNASRLFVIMAGANALLRGTMYLVLTIYYVLVVHMNPFELVFVGTVLEVSYFLSQMPTGIFADMVSRRLSVIVGWAICGAMFAFEGLVPNVTAIMLAQIALGLGEGFIDGAESAWLADEVGPEALGPVLLQGSQVGQVASVCAIVVAVGLASIHLSLPIVLGGVGMLCMSLFFMACMPEDGFRPARHDEEGHRSILRTVADSARLVRGSPVLLTILGAEIFVGGGSEGFDRLWEAHLIRDVHLPAFGNAPVVAVFGLIAVAQALAGLAANRWLKPRVTRLGASIPATARWLSMMNALFVVATVGFGLAGQFALAIVFLMGRSLVGVPASVLRDMWFNRSITDSSVRATVLSMGGQCNAMGQWIGGPLVGVIGSAAGIPAAIAASGLIRLPISVLYARPGVARDDGSAAPAARSVS